MVVVGASTGQWFESSYFGALILARDSLNSGHVISARKTSTSAGRTKTVVVEVFALLNSDAKGAVVEWFVLWVINKSILASWLKGEAVADEAAARVLVEFIAVDGVLDSKIIALLLTKEFVCRIDVICNLDGC